ncbi:MAG: ArsR family transcriptional regulator [Candidatus Heimdallarchaeota archaeon]|nr:ArsR family transcriptional regulator [Candidatus Heimdallarchaeota archaeon]MCG3255018.1 ArsR family transcriptional regulator [Candidatus Heimdallarchaeota archaeon]MCK4610092.1 ArsR family transcriptional regulator [Candidatus Heimdallarchaeota archaeon]
MSEIIDDSQKESPIVDVIYSIFRDGTRRKILTLLGNMKLTADELTKELGISRPAVEKHLKQMLEIGLIERKADTYPTLKYIYTIPSPGLDLLSNVRDAIDTFVSSLREEYTRRLENEEQMYVLGMSSKDRYEAIKKSYSSILERLQ